MTVLSSLLARTRQGERAIQTNQVWGTNFNDDLLPTYNPSGIHIDRVTAMQLSTVWACVNLIAESISTLPMDVFFRRNGTRVPYRPRPSWVDEPNPEQERQQFVSQQLIAMLLDGTAYVFTARDNKGDVVEAWNVPPWLVIPRRVARGQIVYDVRDPLVATTNQADPGLGIVTLDRSQMFHISATSWPGELRGIAPLEAARVMLGTALGAQDFAARYYKQGMTHTGLIEHPDELTPEQGRELKDDFLKRASGLKNAHLPPVLTGGAKWHEMTVTPEQAQFLESRHFSVSEVARFFRVPPHLVGDQTKDTSWGSGIEQQGIGFVTYTLRPWIERLEQAYSRSMLMLGGQSSAFTKFNVSGLLRGDFKTRMEAYAQGRQWGWLSADDILALEDQAPLPNGQGQVYLEPINMRPAGTYQPPAPTAPPTGGTTNA